MPIRSDFQRSLLQAKHSISNWYGMLGIIVASVAIVNFLHALSQFPIGAILRQLLDTYRAVVHGAIDWVTWPINLRVPATFKDLFFLYSVVGGACMRARMSENIYPDHDNVQPLSAIARVILRPRRLQGLVVTPGEIGLSTNNRMVVAYRIAPPWLRRAFDFLLWPRVVLQYWRSPMVYFAHYTATYQTFKAGYIPGPQKDFLYDRRLVLAFQVGAVVLTVFLVLIINGFLTPIAG
jgi:hypothetical protein